MKHLRLLPCYFPLSTCFSLLSIQNRRCFNSTTLAYLKMSKDQKSNYIRLGFTGDVMIGRGIDAILPFSVPSTIHEGYMKDAKGYVNIAIRQNGQLPLDQMKVQGFSYIWGDLLPVLLKSSDCLVVNLETSLTTSEDWEKGKAIHYRAHPKNVECLKVAGVKIATLANNHVLDWGHDGLEETLKTLKDAGILYTGAGDNIEEAIKPAMYTITNQEQNHIQVKICVCAIGFNSAGVPDHWKARKEKCGVNVRSNADERSAKDIMYSMKKIVSTEDEYPKGTYNINVLSLHWGPNWGWGTPESWRRFAHKLVDEGADMVIGHSSHHVKGIEVYKNKMIAYGLGDFLNDYEGIVGQGYEFFRDDLSCLYLPKVKTNGDLLELNIIPCKIKNLRVQRATNPDDIEWLRATIEKEGKELGTTCQVIQSEDGEVNLQLSWTK